VIKVQASVSKGWLHQHGGFVFNQQYYLDPYFRMQQDQKCHDFIKQKFPEYPLYNMEDNLVQAEYVGPNMILVGAIQPNMIISVALGAEFLFASDKDSDVKGFPLKDIKDASELPPVDEVMQLPFIKYLENQVLLARDNYPDCTIIPPFFWDTSGRATIHGIITTSMKFIGQDIYTMMMMEPDLVKGIHQWITDVYIAVIKHFSKLGNLPVTSVHVGECSGTMLDEYSYREFVTPYISQMGREFGAIRLHSCGNADHIIEPICEIENLEIIDTGSNTSLAAIRDRMGRTFEINVFPPVNVLVEGSTREDIQHWLTQTLKDNDGGSLKIEYHLEPDYNWDNCNYIHQELDRLGIVKNNRLY
jgi:uroporphyrinogen-III decarboxylase